MRWLIKKFVREFIKGFASASGQKAANMLFDFMHHDKIIL